MNLPQMCRILQHFDRTQVADIRKSVLAELDQFSWDEIQPGSSMAIAAGSRGILVFKKDNPSDRPELDDLLELPVYFK